MKIPPLSHATSSKVAQASLLTTSDEPSDKDSTSTSSLRSITKSSIGTLLFLGLLAVVKPSYSEEKKEVQSPKGSKNTELVKEDFSKEELYKALESFNNSRRVVRDLPYETQVKLAKALFKDTALAISNLQTDASLYIERTKQFALCYSNPELTKLLLETTDEFRTLVGAQINYIANPKGKKIIVDEVQSLRDTLWWNSYGSGYHLPQGLFDKSWYPEIEKIIKRYEVAKNQERANLLTITCQLAVVEARQSGDKEKNSKICNKLLNLVDSDPQKYFSEIIFILTDTILYTEARLNSDIRTFYRVSDTLASPIEERIIKILNDTKLENSNKQEDKKLYDDALSQAKHLSRNLSRSRCLEVWLDKKVSELSKANINELPTLLNNWFARQENQDLARLIPPDRNSFFTGLIKRACSAYISNNEKEAKCGREVIIILHDNYYQPDQRWPLLENKEITEALTSVFRHIQKQNLYPNPDELELISKLLTISNSNNVTSEAISSINSQINHTPKVNHLILQKKELENHRAWEKAMLVMVERLAMSPLGEKGTLALWIKSRGPLLVNFSQKIVANPSNSDTLSSTCYMLNELNRLISQNQEPELNKFLKEGCLGEIIPSLVIGSKNIGSFHKQTIRKDLFAILETTLSICEYAGNLDEKTITKAVDTIANNFFETTDINGLNELTSCLKQGRQNSPTNTDRALVLRILNKRKDYLETTLQAISKELGSKNTFKERDLLSGLVDYHKCAGSIQSNYLQDSKTSPPQKNYLKQEEIESVEKLLKSTSSIVETVLINNISKIRVEGDFIIGNKLRNIDDEVFVYNLDAVQEILKSSSSISGYIEAIEERLKTEEGSHNRGMLYRALAILPADAKNKSGLTIQQILRDGIAKEKSAVTAKHIGEAIASRYLREVFKVSDDLFVVAHNSEPMYSGPRQTSQQIKFLEDVQSNMNSLKDIVLLARKGKLNEKGNNENYLLAGYISSATIGGQEGLEYFLTKSLGYSKLERKDSDILAQDKDGKVVRINDDVLRLLINSRSALGGIAKTLYKKASSSDIERITSTFDKDEQAKSSLLKTGEQVTSLLERDLVFNTFKMLPHHTAILMDIYRVRNKAEFEDDVKNLNTKIFQGKQNYSLFELHEEMLLSNLSYKHLTSLGHNDFYNSNLGRFWKSLGGLKPEERYERFKSIREAMHRELETLDRDEYIREIVRPLREAKLTFAREILEHTTSMQELRTILNELGVIGQINHIDLRIMLGQDN